MKIKKSEITLSKRDIGLKKRYAYEKRFRFYGLSAIFIALFFLVVLFFSILSKGYMAFQQTTITLPIRFDVSVIDPDNKRDQDSTILYLMDYNILVRKSLAQILQLDDTNFKTKKSLDHMFSVGSRIIIREKILKNPLLLGTSQTLTLLASADLDSAYKEQISHAVDEDHRRISNQQFLWMDILKKKGLLKTSFNTGFFNFGASSHPEMAGIKVSLIGSLYILVLVLLLSVPLGVAASIYLEEYAKKSWITDLIEVNINNLAAVPSIVFGLLGVSVFINFFGFPRSSSIVGGLVLALMTLPTIIISTRSALRSVPSSIKFAAFGIGASKSQVVFSHILPIAAPGVLTGVILSLARALGETAPLLLIGMVAFVKAPPKTIFDAATTLPVQIYMWAAEPERAFVERTSAAIIILLGFLILMNIIAIILRRRFERRR